MKTTYHLSVVGHAAVIFDMNRGPICSIHPLLNDSLVDLDLRDIVEGRSIGVPSFDQAELLADIEDAANVADALFMRLGVDVSNDRV